MRLLSLDLETHKIQPGLLTPPIVCGSVAEWSIPEERVVGARLLTKDEALVEFRRLLLDPDVILAGANIVFDFGVVCATDATFVPLVFAAYKAERVHDLLIAQSLDAIFHGHLYMEPSGRQLLNSKGKHADSYSLDIVTRLCLHRVDAKANDFWRQRYAILENVPQELWPEEARQYPIDDVSNGVEVLAYQLGLHPLCPLDTTGKRKRFENLTDLAAQCYTDWALHLGAIWGFRTDESRINLIKACADELHDEYVTRFTKIGFLRSAEERYLTPEALAAGKTDKKEGTEDSAVVARAIATAYKASGVCENCNGTGKAPKYKTSECRGQKDRGRFRECKGAECLVCFGIGHVEKEDGKVLCKTCSASGYADTSLVPKSEKGAISTSRDTLMESGDEDLADFGENKQEKVRDTYVPYLEQGMHVPLVLQPQVLKETGRVSYRGVIQLFPRDALGVVKKELWVPTLRECIMARPGRVLGSSDYPGGELCALAQVSLWIVGKSEMADAINAKGDPGSLHTIFAARMIGEDPDVLTDRVTAGDKTAKNFRQAAKPCNFGFGGGMGGAKVVLTNRKEGVGMTKAPNGREYAGIRFCILVGGARECGVDKVMEWGRKGKEYPIPPTCRACLEVVEFQLRPLWFKTFPEVKLYHDWVKRWVKIENSVPAFGPWFTRRGTPHRVRGLENTLNPFTSGANAGFQQFIADIAKDALRRVTEEAYLDQDSALFKGQVRVPSFQHDELLSDGLEETAHLWGPRIGQIMHEAYNDWVPDVRITGVDTALMRYWSKGAETVLDAEGRLTVWTPKKKG